MDLTCLYTHSHTTSSESHKHTTPHRPYRDCAPHRNSIFHPIDNSDRDHYTIYNIHRNRDHYTICNIHRNREQHTYADKFIHCLSRIDQHPRCR